MSPPYSSCSRPPSRNSIPPRIYHTDCVGYLPIRFTILSVSDVLGNIVEHTEPPCGYTITRWVVGGGLNGFSDVCNHITDAFNIDESTYQSDRQNLKITEAVNYSLSPSLYTNPSIHVNITDVNNDSVNHSTSHPVIQLHHSLPQYDSLFLQYHNYVSRYNREMNSEQVNALTTTGTKLKMLHRNHKYPPHQYQYHDHHRHHHTHPQPDLHDMQLCKGVMRMGAEEEEEGGGGGGEPKPNFSYIGLIAKAILSTQERRMILSEIYQWIQSRYAYFRTRGPGWRNSIRHNLSLNDCFVKVGRATNGKGHYWGIHPANLKDFLCGDFRRRRAQRKRVH
ncbi:unnamed protein product [Heterobilharzia americana]|nr:unnamed protein product [Heterobilharzia americana]